MDADTLYGVAIGALCALGILFAGLAWWFSKGLDRS